jgi:type I restriction enzyme M protein
MAQLENIEAIEKRLWSAADQLRANSNYASNEYFLPISQMRPLNLLVAGG